VCEWVKEIPAVVSAIAAAVAAFFAYQAIAENRKNVFLLDKNRVALAINKISKGFDCEFGDFKISEYADEQAIILAAKYHFPAELYGRFTDFLVSLHQLEKMRGDWSETNSKAEEVADLIKQVECDVRLDLGV
tara:strand:- start:4065 stop:4463 length:399 start_codon:yes stop_codon:yes gene_type:complete